MTAELTPMGSAAVRLAERAVRLRRERDAARDLACAYEAQLAKVHGVLAAGHPGRMPKWWSLIERVAFKSGWDAAERAVLKVLDIPDE